MFFVLLPTLPTQLLVLLPQVYAYLSLPFQFPPQELILRLQVFHHFFHSLNLLQLYPRHFDYLVALPAKGLTLVGNLFFKLSPLELLGESAIFLLE